MVGTLDKAADSISGALAQQVNQMDQKNKTCSRLRCKNKTLWPFLRFKSVILDYLETQLYFRYTLNKLPVE